MKRHSFATLCAEDGLLFYSMKRRLLTLIALVIALSALIAWSRVRAMAMAKREVGYEAALRTYAEALHPGLTRKDVEDNLRSRNIKFTEITSNFGERRNRHADLVELGEEETPIWMWYCGKQYIDVAFVFESRHEQSDYLLEKIELFRHEDCI